jgi:hypothetical protein
MKIKIIKEWGREIYRKVRWHKDAEFWYWIFLCILVIGIMILMAIIEK